MLEQQQSQLVAGLQETYRRLLNAQIWPGAPLAEHNGNPLTHDILAGLNLLEMKQDGSGELEEFEEDCQKLQQRLVSNGAPYVGRRGSFSSESDHDPSHHHARNSSRSSLHGTPSSSQAQSLFAENWKFEPSPSPVHQSPTCNMAKPRPSIKPSPLSNESANRDDFYSSPAWPAAFPDQSLRPSFNLQLPTAHDNLISNWTQSADHSFDNDGQAISFDPQYINNHQPYAVYNAADWMNEPMDLEFNNFVQQVAS